MNILHFRNFLKPNSLEVRNKSRSFEPIKAPEKALESGDIANDVSMIITDTRTITTTSAYMPSILA